MADFLTASLVFALLVFSFSVSADQIITAKPGDNVILPCREDEKKDVSCVEWKRTDLEPDQHVLTYRNNQSDPEGQSPSFRNRVDLLDVKNGDVSLVLKNVTTDDTGTYECRVIQRGNNRRKRSIQKSISIINLSVEAGNEGKQEVDGGNKGGPKEDGGSKTGWIIGVSVSVVAVAVVVGGVAAVFHKRSRDSSLKSKRPPAAADAEEKLTGPDE